ncbi:hypothetical protein T440DRAFT_401632 [Plenodomus tracheiphilus IPT5]|uniref:Endoplasmic reticulum-based factor for assembly of V-ATPase-domain-containing protein n=1 Tax=Plenodomus tracheiphilus IPT5 TaxID=1408161 RepID=A0A6A7B1H2_9PLEO|nr:hypothetical protein T440DRAFT_401632 [Plenodomus tracheiphilus IPT5]
MVLLTITPGIRRGLESGSSLCPDGFAKLSHEGEPALSDATLGAPISHTQLIALSKLLKQHATRPSSPLSPETQRLSNSTLQDTEHDDSAPPQPQTLSTLLQTTTLYRPPPPPKPPQTPEYTALMSRLRHNQESLSYTRMLNPPPTRETFSQRFPSTQGPSPFTSHAPSSTLEDDVSYEEVHRQIILIINILISVVAVSVFLWVAARHWSVGKRLGLSLGGSLGIAVAEVAVYGGYVRKVKEAKRVERRKPEIKEIVKSWAVGGGDKAESVEGVDVSGKDKGEEVDGMRFRKGKHR